MAKKVTECTQRFSNKKIHVLLRSWELSAYLMELYAAIANSKYNSVFRGGSLQ